MTLSTSLLDAKFVLLLGALGILRFACPPRFFPWLLCVGSAGLIGLASPKTLLAIAGVTLLWVYPMHRLLKIGADRGWSERKLHTVLALGIGLLVFLLVFFKVYREFTIPWFGGGLIRKEFLAIAGFSYFIFRAISILRINALMKVHEGNPLTMLCYALFPPTLTSGPIQKYQDFRQQVAKPLPVSRNLLLDAGYRITRGYFRKVVLAVILNGFAQKLMGQADFTILTSVLTLAVLYFYFYFDFAGYSDIAIGFGLLYGIRVPENFRKPFQATTISEFWRNWHITLVDWLRENVFIPLGGMRGSRTRAAALVFLIMVLCGLWHGLSLTFIAWGAWHGSWLAFEALAGAGPLPPALRHGPKYWAMVLWTNARVAFASILFLPDTTTMLRLLKGLTKLGGF